MSKKIVIGLVAIIVLGAAGFYAYKYYLTVNQKRNDVATMFDYFATDAMKSVEEDKSTTTDPKKLGFLENIVKTIQVVKLIAERNVEGLKETDIALLQDKIFRMYAPGDRFKTTMGGRLVKQELQAINAIPIVLYHSALDRTDEDKEKTIAMLQVLFDKKLTPVQEVGMMYWVKDNPSDTRSLPYSSMIPLADFAKYYSFDKAIELLEKYTQEFGHDKDPQKMHEESEEQWNKVLEASRRLYSQIPYIP